MTDLPNAQLRAEMRPHLHTYLKLRLGIYLFVSLLVGGFVVYSSIRNSVPGYYAVAGVCFGVLIGLFFSRTHKVSWDENASRVIARVDIFGIFVLLLYFSFELFRDKIVGRFVADVDVTVTSFSILAGLFYGRILGFRGNILRVLREKEIL